MVKRKRATTSNGGDADAITKRRGGKKKAHSPSPYPTAETDIHYPYTVMDDIPVSLTPVDVSLLEDPLSVKDSFALSHSLAQSRNKWLSGAMFTKFWTRPPRGRKLAEGEVNAREKMAKLCECLMAIGPHIFDVKLFIVKDETKDDSKDDAKDSKDVKDDTKNEKNDKDEKDDKDEQDEKEDKDEKDREDEKNETDKKDGKNENDEKGENDEKSEKDDDGSKVGENVDSRSSNDTSKKEENEKATSSTVSSSPRHTESIEKNQINSTTENKTVENDSTPKEKVSVKDSSSQALPEDKDKPVSTALSTEKPVSPVLASAPAPAPSSTPIPVPASEHVESTNPAQSKPDPSKPISDPEPQPTQKLEPTKPSQASPLPKSLEPASKSPVPSKEKPQNASPEQSSHPAPSSSSPPASTNNPNNMATIMKLQAIARIDRSLNSLMKIVASGNATPEQITAFQAYINRARSMELEDIPKYFKPVPENGGDSAVVSANGQAPAIKPAIAPSATLTAAGKPRAKKKDGTPRKPGKPRGRTAGSKKNPDGPKKKDPNKPKTTYIPKKLQKKVTIVFEFKDNPADRYIIPKNSIIEILPTNEVLISFLLLFPEGGVKRSPAKLPPGNMKVGTPGEPAVPNEDTSTPDDQPKPEEESIDEENKSQLFYPLTVTIRNMPVKSLPILERSVNKPALVADYMKETMAARERAKNWNVWFQIDKRDEQLLSKLVLPAKPPDNMFIPARVRVYKSKRKAAPGEEKERKKSKKDGKDTSTGADGTESNFIKEEAAEEEKDQPAKGSAEPEIQDLNEHAAASTEKDESNEVSQINRAAPEHALEHSLPVGASSSPSELTAPAIEPAPPTSGQGMLVDPTLLSSRPSTLDEKQEFNVSDVVNFDAMED